MPCVWVAGTARQPSGTLGCLRAVLRVDFRAQSSCELRRCGFDAFEGSLAPAVSVGENVETCDSGLGIRPLLSAPVRILQGRYQGYSGQKSHEIEAGQVHGRLRDVERGGAQDYGVE